MTTSYSEILSECGEEGAEHAIDLTQEDFDLQFGASNESFMADNIARLMKDFQEHQITRYFCTIYFL